jgi:hypothetical protein
MADIARELRKRDVPVRVGSGDNYDGETIVFNSRYLTPMAAGEAIVNSVFVTHVDDCIREAELRAAFKTFNSFVCMSPQEADFVAGLRGARSGVVGIELPVRNSAVRPLRISMFSAFYEDGRKNENWIVEYLQSKSASDRQELIFCFLGQGWERFCARLASLEANYEIVRYSRNTPGEYELYRRMLVTADLAIYVGFDGGAMSVYDAVSEGVNVVAPNISYHRGLGGTVRLFENKAGFFAILDEMVAKQRERRSDLNDRSIETYVDRLLAHWADLASALSAATSNGTAVTDAPPLGPVEEDALRRYRGYYKRLSVTRVRSALIRYAQAFVMRRKGG